MPSNEDAHPENPRLKKVRVGFHVAGYLGRTIGSGLTLGLVSKGIQRASDAIRGYKRISSEGSVTLNVGGEDKELPKTFLGKKIPPGKTLESLTTEMQDKLNRGERLLHEIEEGTAPKQCSSQNMTDIMAYLQARAQTQHGHFTEGSMHIPDPGNKIKNFLDTHPDAYMRNSSHIGDFQNQESGVGVHRGIDVYGRTRNMDESLPNGRKALMYGSLNQNDGLKMNEERLWIKMEPHGAWAFSPKVNDPNGPKRAANAHDGKAAVGHSLSFLETRGQGSAKGSRKERIPDDIKKAWKALQKEARQEFKGKEPPSDELAAMLRDGEGLQTARGVRFINSYLESMKNSGELSPELKARAQYMQHTLKSRFPQDTMDVRIGNEVILKTGDLRPRNKQDIPVPTPKQTQNQTHTQVKGIGSLGEEAANKARVKLKSK
jgi:hypothetical protein